MKHFFLLMCLALPLGLSAQQVADTSYRPYIAHPAYASHTGPIVFIDEGHHNFHTREGRYLAFARLLERDGYVVKSYTGPFEKQALAQGKMLVISNALHESTLGNWVLPNPSAFTVEEIKTLAQWVSEGGSLWLIADHMPMAGAAQALAARFGFAFTNGFAMRRAERGPDYFKLENGSLVASILTQGRDTSEAVSQVVSFTGQAFQMPAAATPILQLQNQYENLLPDTAWAFRDHTPRQSTDGWVQGAFRPYGKGKVVVFGEAAMFSAQLAGPQQFKAGMNSPVASQNYKLLLNIIHWLDGILK